MGGLPRPHDGPAGASIGSDVMPAAIHGHDAVPIRLWRQAERSALRCQLELATRGRRGLLRGASGGVCALDLAGAFVPSACLVLDTTVSSTCGKADGDWCLVIFVQVLSEL